jgi:protein TonB
MTTAISRSAAEFAHAKSRPSTQKLRVLQAEPTRLALAQWANTKPAGPQSPREIGLLVLLALSFHILIGVGIWNRSDEPRKARFSQEMELLRPQPEIKPEPPKPVPPPPKKIEPPKAVEPPKPTPLPPAALRTAPAEAPQPNTLTVAENLTAAKTTGPVVAAPPPPPPPAPAPKVEEPVTEANGSAAYLNNPPPAYPKAAQRQGLQGRVLLRVQVLANGTVGTLEVKQSSGKAVLDEAALAAVKSWIFTPAKRGNTPIDGWTQVPIEFRLAQ